VVSAWKYILNKVKCRSYVERIIDFYTKTVYPPKLYSGTTIVSLSTQKVQKY